MSAPYLSSAAPRSRSGPPHRYTLVSLLSPLTLSSLQNTYQFQTQPLCCLPLLASIVSLALRYVAGIGKPTRHWLILFLYAVIPTNKEGGFSDVVFFAGSHRPRRHT